MVSMELLGAVRDIVKELNETIDNNIDVISQVFYLTFENRIDIDIQVNFLGGNIWDTEQSEYISKIGNGSLMYNNIKKEIIKEYNILYDKIQLIPKMKNG